MLRCLVSPLFGGRIWTILEKSMNLQILSTSLIVKTKELVREAYFKALVYTNSKNRTYFVIHHPTPLFPLVEWHNRTDFGCSCKRG
jgi:hypothetical protein